MPKRGGKFVLSSAEEAQLQQLIRAQGTPQGLAQRARVVQLAAQGMGVRAIGGRVGMHYNQVAKWRRRYLRGGIGALQDEPRSGRKGNLSTELLRQIVDQATRPPQGRVRWTCRAMAREFGVSKATVQRVWSQNEIKPHLTRVFKLSSDPNFEVKFWDVIGLYLNPPEQAVVLVVTRSARSRRCSAVNQVCLWAKDISALKPMITIATAPSLSLPRWITWRAKSSLTPHRNIPTASGWNFSSKSTAKFL